MITRVCNSLSTNYTECSCTSEHEGRHPCIVDHCGRVIHFAGEDKAALAGTAPDKAAKRRSKHKSAATSDDEQSSDCEFDAPPAHFVPTGITSPSGHARKRARVEPPNTTASPPPQRVTDRHVKAIPTRIPADSGADPRKRKRTTSDAAGQQADVWHGPDMTRVEVAPGQFPLHERGATPMYPPQGLTAPFAMQPLYGGHNVFSGAPYQAPFYPQQLYGPPGWNQMALNNGAQQWPAANAYNQEEMDLYTGMRRGGYGNGAQY